MNENPDNASNLPNEIVTSTTLDEIGEALRERGLTLEDIIEQGREIRVQLLSELHGINDGDPPGRTPRQL